MVIFCVNILIFWYLSGIYTAEVNALTLESSNLRMRIKIDIVLERKQTKLSNRRT